MERFRLSMKGLSAKPLQLPPQYWFPSLKNATVHSRSNCTTTIPTTTPQSRVAGGYLLSDCLWSRGCSLRKLLLSTGEKMGHLS